MSQDNHLIIEKDGYPLQIESIQTLNDGVQQALTNIAAVCGSNTILKGCADEVREGVTYVTDGIMCIGGKIYQFRGGKKTGGVTIITTKVDDIYDTGDGSAKQMLPVRGFSYVTSSPEGSSNIAWSSFVRVADLKQITSDLKEFREVQSDVNTLKKNEILAKGSFVFVMNKEDQSFVREFDNVVKEPYKVFYSLVYAGGTLSPEVKLPDVLCDAKTESWVQFSVKGTVPNTPIHMSYTLDWFLLKE